MVALKLPFNPEDKCANAITVGKQWKCTWWRLDEEGSS
jgi:hypothetical protein